MSSGRQEKQFRHSIRGYRLNFMHTSAMKKHLSIFPSPIAHRRLLSILKKKKRISNWDLIQVQFQRSYLNRIEFLAFNLIWGTCAGPITWNEVECGSLTSGSNADPNHCCKTRLSLSESTRLNQFRHSRLTLVTQFGDHLTQRF